MINVKAHLPRLFYLPAQSFAVESKLWHLAVPSEAPTDRRPGRPLWGYPHGSNLTYHVHSTIQGHASSQGHNPRAQDDEHSFNKT